MHPLHHPHTPALGCVRGDREVTIITRLHALFPTLITLTSLPSGACTVSRDVSLSGLFRVFRALISPSPPPSHPCSRVCPR